MKITQLQDIQVYKEALLLTHKTYDIVKNDRFSREYSFVDQIKRASLSVAANIAEGYGRKTNT